MGSVASPPLFTIETPGLRREPATDPDSIIQLEVIGIPAPQGSKTAIIVNKGTDQQRAVLIEGGPQKGGGRMRHQAWRTAVAMTCRGYLSGNPRAPIDEPVGLVVEFRFPPGTDKYRTRHSTTPDLDKLLRSTLDAIVDGGLLKNDSRVCMVIAAKRYTKEGEPAGASITIDCVGALEAADRERMKREAKGVA